MDPLQTLRELLYAVIANDNDRTEELAEALDNWLVRGGYAPVPAQPKPGYQGWKNYETWAVHLWLTGDQATDRHCCGLARQALQSAPHCGQVRSRIWAADDAPRFLLADAFKEFIDSRNPLRENASVYSDLLGSALYEVDWYEVADAFLERVKP